MLIFFNICFCVYVNKYKMYMHIQILHKNKLLFRMRLIAINSLTALLMIQKQMARKMQRQITAADKQLHHPSAIRRVEVKPCKRADSQPEWN